MRPVRVFIAPVLGMLYKILFGRSDLRRSKLNEARLARDIQGECSFLFEEQSAQIITNPDARHPRPFDYAVVRIATGNLLLSFTRGRGELTVEVCAAQHPGEWSELAWALAAVGGLDQIEPRAFSSLRDVAEVLKPRIDRLKEAYSEERYPETNRFLTGVKDHERAVARQLSAELNRKLYG